MLRICKTKEQVRSLQIMPSASIPEQENSLRKNTVELEHRPLFSGRPKLHLENVLVFVSELLDNPTLNFRSDFIKQLATCNM
jgi:hypothetical protein